MVEEAQAPPETMLVDCAGCEKPVLATVHAHSFYWDSEEPPERWSFVTCNAKHHPMLILQNDFSYPNSYNDDDPWRAYPPQDRVLSTEIPAALRRELEEARICFQAKAYSAAVVMSGRVLEGVCVEFGFTSGTLDQRLVKMKDAEHIDGRLAEWASMLRQVRNAGAHFDVSKARIERADAEDSLAFCEALLDYLYVLKARFEALQARRNPPKIDASGARALGVLIGAGVGALADRRAAKRAPKLAPETPPIDASGTETREADAADTAGGENRC